MQVLSKDASLVNEVFLEKYVLGTSSGRPMAVDREFVYIVVGAIRSKLSEQLNLERRRTIMKPSLF